MKRFVALLCLTSVFITTAGAQRTRPSTVAANTPASRTKCSGAWTGTITYTRIQNQSDNKTVPRVSGRGKDTRDWQFNYNYSAQVAVIEDPSRPGQSIGRATINHSMTSVEKVEGVEENSCDRGKTFQPMYGTSTSRTETTGTGTVEANVNIGVNSDGTYSVSVGLPQIKGQVTGSTESSFSGQCTPKPGKSSSLPATDTSLDGHSLTSDGTTRINESDPNRLSGSYTMNLPGGVAETITWSLQKCGAPLRITDLKFQDMKFPTWNAWRDITEQVGTIDGNLVKIKATVLNTSGESKTAHVKFKETYKGDKWDGARPDGLLENGDQGIDVPAGEAKDVDLVWDSSGYSWFDDGRPRLVQRIKAELEENGKKTDEMTKNIKVAPKPLVLVHGLWSSWKAWETWQNILTTTHSYDWKAFPVGEHPDKGVMNTGGSFLSTQPTKSIGENANELEKYIRYAQEDRNAWHIDVVAHSMGGLISRYYISQMMKPLAEDGRPQIAHLVMLGTPNMGSPCADVMNVVFESLGENVEAVRQLRQDYVEGFNKVNKQRKGVKFSALAGNPLPTMCKQIVWNDGVVPVPSAKWTVADNAESKSLHTDLTGTSDFSSFVRPRLAVGPHGDHNPAAPQAPGLADYSHMPSDRLLASVFLQPGMFTQDFAKGLKLTPKQSTEIEVPVETASNLGITFMADPKVSVTLVDDKGSVGGSNLAGSPESRGWFRSIFIDKPVIAGKWKLRIENTDDLEHPVYISAWMNATK